MSDGKAHVKPKIIPDELNGPRNSYMRNAGRLTIGKAWLGACTLDCYGTGGRSSEKT